MNRRLIVTHHAPDLDAITAVWLLKRFDNQHYADARVAFVNPGSTITLEAAEEYGLQLHEVTHVDTGLGEFDHHQPDRGLQRLSAASLVYDYLVKLHPELSQDAALKTVAEFVTDVDHFGEIYWPEADHLRYSFMIQDLIHGMEFQDPHDDDSQLHFGEQCLNNAYATLTQQLKAKEILDTEGQEFSIKIGKALGLETRNDETIKLAQKRGYCLVIRKDPKEGNLRIKARPDAQIDLTSLYQVIKTLDQKGTWYNHPSGKMLINGSRKHRNQTASPLALKQVIELVKQVYG